MAVYSRVSYLADGETDTFNVPFPFISKTHVGCEINGLPVETNRTEWLTASSIKLRDVPAAGSLVEIIRSTPMDARLVDFQNGAVLTEAELDLAHLQNFYLTQETHDEYSNALDQAIVRLAEGGNIVTTTPEEVIGTVVNQVLLDETAATIQQRIADIDDLSAVTLEQLARLDDFNVFQTTQMNIQTQLGDVQVIQDARLANVEATIDGLVDIDGTGITTFILNEQQARVDGDIAVQSQIDLMGAVSGDGLAFVLNTDTAMVSPTESLATRLSGIQATLDVNAGGVSSVASSVVAEETARVAADAAIASTVTALQAQVDTNGDGIADVAASVTSEATTRAAADTALASSITALQAQVDTNGDGITDAAASVTAEANTRAAADTAIAATVTALQAQVDTNGDGIADVAASVTAEATTRASGDTALASSITALQAQVDTNGDGIADVAASVTAEATARTSGDAALATSITSLQTQADANGDGVADALAAVVAEQNARTSADTAIASDVTSLGARVTTTEGDITTLQGTVTTEATARADGDAANAALITTVQAAVDTNADLIADTQASVTSEATTRANADSANASAINSVSAIATARNTVFRQAAAPTANAVGDLWIETDQNNRLRRWDGTSWVVTDNTQIAANAAAITNEATARANGDSAVAATVTTLTARVDGHDTSLASNLAAIQSEATVRATNDNALASDITTLFGRVDGADAAIVSEASARASAVSAVASNLTALQARVTTTEGNISSAMVLINSSATAITNAENRLTTVEAQYGVQLDVNGHVTGFRQINDGTTGLFDILADKFRIVDPANPGVAAKTVFDISGGVVSIPDLVVGNAQITNLNVDRLVSGALDADVTVDGDLTMGTGRVVFDNGTYMKVQGVGFGASSNLIEWFGPKMAISAMTTANGTAYLTTTGDAYFGGALSSGVLTNSGTATVTTPTGTLVVGPFGSNGGTIIVNHSYAFTRGGTVAGNQTPSGTTSATLKLYRTIAGSAETLIATRNVTGSMDAEYDTEENTTSFLEQMSGSWAYSDNAATTADRTYRFELTARSNKSPSGGSITQRFSIIATEE